MIADIFFFFEYLWEEGLGPTSDWEKFNSKNTAIYNHGLNKRLKPAENGELQYNERVAIRDSLT